MYLGTKELTLGLFLSNELGQMAELYNVTFQEHHIDLLAEFFGGI